MPSQEGVPVFILGDDVSAFVIARSPCGEAIQTASAERILACFAALAMTMREAAECSTLVPRTQRSAPSAVRCRAGAHSVDGNP